MDTLATIFPQSTQFPSLNCRHFCTLRSAVTHFIKNSQLVSSLPNSISISVTLGISPMDILKNGSWKGIALHLLVGLDTARVAVIEMFLPPPSPFAALKIPMGLKCRTSGLKLCLFSVCLFSNSRCHSVFGDWLIRTARMETFRSNHCSVHFCEVFPL